MLCRKETFSLITEQRHENNFKFMYFSLLKQGTQGLRKLYLPGIFIKRLAKLMRDILIL